jgi:hypothetical protein
MDYGVQLGRRFRGLKLWFVLRAYGRKGIVDRLRNHVAWAQDKKSWWPASKQEDRTKGLLVQFDERAGTTWTQNEKTGMPQRNGMPLGLR